MKKLTKKIIYVSVLSVFSFGFYTSSVLAVADLTLEKINDCDLSYMGGSCLVEMKASNNTGGILDGKLNVEVSYKGEPFDGEGMILKFLPEPTSLNWLDSSLWDNGKVYFDNFNINEGETIIFVKITTHVALSGGEYPLAFKLQGTSESGEVFESQNIPLSYGGGGGNGIPGTVTAPKKGEDGKFYFLDIPTEILEEIKKLPDDVIDEVINFVRQNPNYFEDLNLTPQEDGAILLDATTTRKILDEVLNEAQMASAIDSGIGKKIESFLKPIATSPIILVIIFVLVLVLIRKSFFF
ncbi:hypothetical protein KKC45_00340 [Patescibacteria group bacterium]|nr:hypothetical protein [Patescibacteria group bacterium]